jgi:glycosyltransferase involved in cell wall biosynthesis
MKLIVQIPCYNEEATLPQTLADIPRQFEGVDEVEVLIVDDGSSDNTVAVAKAHGVEHIIRHKNNQGLARAFKTGLDASIRKGADIIVNTDGDNQYRGKYIADLIAPILAGEADIVIGDRQVGANQHFSKIKQCLQALGSFVVRRLSKTEVPDAVSGFRAISRSAAIGMNILSPFSYTIEMLIQAGQRKLAIISVPIETNAPTRKSRLFKTVPHFLQKSLTTMVRAYTMYHPLRMFFLLGTILLIIGAIPVGRFLYFFVVGEGTGHIQSLVLGGTFLIMGFMSYLVSLIADIINFNRQLIEMTLQRVTEMELRLEQRGRPASDDRDSAE